MTAFIYADYIIKKKKESRPTKELGRLSALGGVGLSDQFVARHTRYFEIDKRGVDLPAYLRISDIPVNDHVDKLQHIFRISAVTVGFHSPRNHVQSSNELCPFLFLPKFLIEKGKKKSIQRPSFLRS